MPKTCRKGGVKRSRARRTVSIEEGRRGNVRTVPSGRGVAAYHVNRWGWRRQVRQSALHVSRSIPCKVGRGGRAVIWQVAPARRVRVRGCGAVWCAMRVRGQVRCAEGRQAARAVGAAALLPAMRCSLHADVGYTPYQPCLKRVLSRRRRRCRAPPGAKKMARAGAAAGMPKCPCGGGAGKRAVGGRCVCHGKGPGARSKGRARRQVFCKKGSGGKWRFCGRTRGMANSEVRRCATGGAVKRCA